MPLIEKPEKIEKKALGVAIPISVHQDLEDYQEFLGAKAGHIVSEALRYFFARDAEFKAWKKARAEQSERVRAIA